MFTANSANLFASDLTSDSTSDFTSDLTNLLTSELVNMFYTQIRRNVSVSIVTTTYVKSYIWEIKFVTV